MPESADMYLHRVARSGRFGTKGLAISLVSSAEDLEVLKQVESRFMAAIAEMPEEINTADYL